MQMRDSFYFYYHCAAHTRSIHIRATGLTLKMNENKTHMCEWHGRRRRRCIENIKYSNLLRGVYRTAQEQPICVHHPNERIFVVVVEDMINLVLLLFSRLNRIEEKDFILIYTFYIYKHIYIGRHVWFVFTQGKRIKF